MKDRSEIGIVAATTRYEAWLAERIPLVKPDLELKHHAMSAGIFPFLRATFYRWAARWRALVGDVAAAPTVLAVGDRTWRTSGPGATRRGGWCGVSTTSTKRGRCRTPTTWCGSPPARWSRANITT